MADKHYQVVVEKDHISKLASAKPIPAVAELVWNGLDADASRVGVTLERGALGLEAVVVTDNGHGIAYEEAEGLFGRLGGSWKANGNRSRKRGRILHGKEGKGRFKALALGRVADWTSVYRAEDGRVLRFTITIIRDNLTDVRVTEPEEVGKGVSTGVEVRITELDRSFRSLEADQAVQPFSELFALYLTDYEDVAVFVDNAKLDPESLIQNRAEFALTDVMHEGKTYGIKLHLIEWKSSAERWVFLCGDEGFPFQRLTPTFHTPGHQFSAYLRSRLLDELQSTGQIDLADFTPALKSAYDEAADLTKGYFKDLDAEQSRSEIERWKEQNVYPYREPAETVVEIAERQVFDILALNLNKQLPTFSDQDSRTKAFQLRILRHAVERGPEELQHIFTEVLQLPVKKQQELSQLLRDADLGNIITASRLVADRMKFLTGLEALIFDPETKPHVKERSQLHRILAEGNTWVFGEEFNLTVDDQSLTEVLRKHQQLIGEEVVIDAPVKRIDGKVGIVDLMLSRSVPTNRSDEREHLVVELKRPSKKVGGQEIMQAKNYAYTVAKDERFRHIKTRWTFWVVSNDLDEFAQTEARQKDKPRGQVAQTDDGLVEVWVKSWAELFAESKGRMRFVQDRLQASVDREDALAYLRKTYAKYLNPDIEEIEGEGDRAPEVEEAPA
ncbi:ATP-binding protein [Devosia sp. 63-57]|uniref:ATP-binding protein n=1 Tax=Devosia sp. 63-57 TaxID=1895751 RepID=UPI0008684499|nr:ATP-binding protein [Devosia sp. 63-57]ODT47670.1 MAG: hypothetical protein ABS74_15620 [Pelagibacterium sp. SCN 63-126]ODU88271.1 MAG: hypothetical protein ABT14_03520 [Pelagibacterium sp. SCN 63-17]OJX42622.1 MAG: hypothetical protein BGO80_14240 [Devosia sp. 63-57]